MTASTSRLCTLAALGAVAAGCTAPNPGVTATVALDQPSVVTARGARPMSELALHRQGLVDPAGHQMTMEIRDAQLKLERTDDGRMLLESLSISLADADLPPSDAMPEGVALRNQQLDDVGVVRGELLTDGPDLLVVRTASALRYRTSTVLPDGTLYRLGDTLTQATPFDLRVARDPVDGRVTVTLDGSAAQECWAIDGVLTVSDCALYLESDGTIAPPPNAVVFR